jgi:NAD(P)-dependent dehydrogenase (short-subunit alcohol dehydrogenase family)
VMTQRQLDLWVDDEARNEIAKSQCLPGALMPDDIASMVLFLAADDSAMCTAQEFIVDAGWV